MKDQNIILPSETVIKFLTSQHDLSRTSELNTVKNLFEWMRSKFSQGIPQNLDWFETGVDCMLLSHLKPSAKWVNGKISIQIIFTCDEFNTQREDSFSTSPDSIDTNDDDVFCFPIELLQLNSGDRLNMTTNIFTRKEFIVHLRTQLSLSDKDYYRYAWLDYGVPCKVLTPGVSNGWSEGRICLDIGFQSKTQDSEIKSESSLDEIRNSIETN